MSGSQTTPRRPTAADHAVRQNVCRSRRNVIPGRRRFQQPFEIACSAFEWHSSLIALCGSLSTRPHSPASAYTDVDFFVQSENELLLTTDWLRAEEVAQLQAEVAGRGSTHPKEFRLRRLAS